MGISFIVPLYNEENYIQKTIETIFSAANELSLDFEVVVVDDASTDNSIARVLELDDERIYLLKNERNMGLAKTYKRGVDTANKEFVQYIPSDDVLGREDLRNILTKMESGKAILQYCKNINERTFFRRSISLFYTKYLNSISKKEINYYNGLNIYPRDFVLSFDGFDDGFAFQAELVLRALETLEVEQVGTTCCFKDDTSSALRPKNIFKVLRFMIKKRIS